MSRLPSEERWDNSLSLSVLARQRHGFPGRCRASMAWRHTPAEACNRHMNCPMGMGTLQRKDLPFRDVSRIIEIKTGLLLLLAGFGGKDVGAVDYGGLYPLPPGLWGGPEDGSAGILPDAWADAGGQSHAPFLGGSARPGGRGHFLLRLHLGVPVLPE